MVHFLSLLGYMAIAVALLVLGRLSHRLNSVTNTPPYYLGLYIAAALVFIGRIFSAYLLLRSPSWLSTEPAATGFTLLSSGLPAIGITLALAVVWYYWSWLLAERD